MSRSDPRLATAGRTAHTCTLLRISKSGCTIALAHRPEGRLAIRACWVSPGNREREYGVMHKADPRGSTERIDASQHAAAAADEPAKPDLRTRWPDVRRLFEAALDLPAGQRAAFVAAESADAELQAAVLAMLASAFILSGFVIVRHFWRLSSRNPGTARKIQSLRQALRSSGR